MHLLVLLEVFLGEVELLLHGCFLLVPSALLLSDGLLVEVHDLLEFLVVLLLQNVETLLAGLGLREALNRGPEILLVFGLGLLKLLLERLVLGLDLAQPLVDSLVLLLQELILLLRQSLTCLIRRLSSDQLGLGLLQLLSQVLDGFSRPSIIASLLVSQLIHLGLHLGSEVIFLLLQGRDSLLVQNLAGNGFL